MIIKTLRNEDEKKLREYIKHVRKAARTVNHPKKQQKKPANYKITSVRSIGSVGELLSILFREEKTPAVPELLK